MAVIRKAGKARQFRLFTFQKKKRCGKKSTPRQRAARNFRSRFDPFCPVTKTTVDRNLSAISFHRSLVSLSPAVHERHSLLESASRYRNGLQ